jgi:hypothetical protein
VSRFFSGFFLALQGAICTSMKLNILITQANVTNSTVDMAARMDVGGGDLITFDGPMATRATNQVMKNENSTLNLGHLYTQCRAAREYANAMPATVFNNNSGFKLESVAMPRIGGLDWLGDPVTEKTFHGGRIAKRGCVVNESVSMSFDPRNLQCLGCKKPHSVTSSSPLCIILAD